MEAKDFNTITDIVENKVKPNGAEWILIAFDRETGYQVVTSLWDAEGMPALKAVLKTMLGEVDNVEQSVVKPLEKKLKQEEIYNEKWDGSGRKC